MSFWDDLKNALSETADSLGEVGMQERYGPDWRGRIEESRTERRRRGEQEADRSAMTKLSLADALARHVSDMMEGQPEEGGPPPALPPDVVARTGMSPEDIVKTGKGKFLYSKRQLQVLRGAQGLEREGAQAGHRQELSDSQAADRAALQAARDADARARQGAHEAFIRGMSEGAADRRAREQAQRDDARDTRLARSELLRQQRDIEKQIGDAAAMLPPGASQDDRDKILAPLYLKREQLGTQAELLGRMVRGENVGTSSETADVSSRAVPAAPDETVTNTALGPVRGSAGAAPKHGAPVARRRRPDGGYEYRDAQGVIWQE